MPRSEAALSGYRPMWLFVMFDLPVRTREQRREYARFRKLLLREGFSQLQYSVYARYLGSEEVSDSFRARIRTDLPPKGQVRLVSLTDRQFGKMEVYCGKKRTPTESAPEQLLLF